MKGITMLDCPACAGPDAPGGDCATCRGTTQVTQEVHDVFMVEKARRDELLALKSDVVLATNSSTSVEELKQALQSFLI